MRTGKRYSNVYAYSWIVALLSFSFQCFVRCQLNTLAPTQLPDSATRDVLTRMAYNSLDNLTTELLSSRLVQDYSFCIENPEADWNNAFNYSEDSSFLTNCLAKTGDVNRRLCTAAEVDIYFVNLRNGFNRLGRNRNCNSSYWVNGCEPGWACSTSSDESVDLKNSEKIPSRVLDCKPCCEGFFCPKGLTCMMPCPLGAYCPLATLNRNTGLCHPYSYGLPRGFPSHTCGGANVWADLQTNREIFCSAGSYCPTNIRTLPCSSGNYCPRGSTSERKCSSLTTCNSQTESQNIRVYGGILIGGLTVLLLVVYNCSGLFLSIREKRYTKSREMAAMDVQGKIEARARWKYAKDAALKHVIELQSQFSVTFSRRSLPNPEEVEGLNSAETGTIDDDSPSTSNDSEQSNVTYDEVKRESSLHLHKIKDSSKEIHTRSKMFNYAYTELEREKAQHQQNRTFSDKRPLIEISYKDLTVTLKGGNKTLLKSVTGKITPGRVTATMGPSGAGKTTFLSALTEKAVGCKVTGTVLINGKAISIRSYRKIIGFVPQDDIVHGNLTVEENLWFSARCRLSADLLKQDKVLIVERVIDSLGLQAIRSSLVGTVEKRGISGGQRKRVNVGLELVMEPSLLFLDEPTSGLDSSSSQLLLRALKREAQAGVNICMVVHQPSYTLFQMFDDLILLAKGGLTVYQGPVEKVEEYFAGLGIYVPEHVNPPDYFIDILEGLVKTSSSQGISHDELPVRWMLHNGYHVPSDMRLNTTSITLPASSINPDTSVVGQSFAGEVWEHIKSSVEKRREVILHNLRSTNLSNRRTPNILLQYWYFLGRLSKQRVREANTQAVDYLILLIAGACLGSLTGANDANFGFGAFTHTIIAVSLLCKIAALRTFALDKLQYWRESSSGISSLAHFVAKDTIDLFNSLIKPLIYLSMFYFFSHPRSSFADNYVILLCLVYCVSGIAYSLAIFLEPGPSQLCSVLLPVVLTLVATQLHSSNFVKTVANFCYPKWALEAFVIANSERYNGVWLLTRCGVLQRFGYNVNHFGFRVSLLILTGVAFRAIAFFGMLLFRKK